MRPMSRSALKVLLAACSCLAHASQPGPEAGIHAEPRVDAFFAAFDQPSAPGCALGVIRNGEFAYRRGYGVANLEFDAPITPQSVFRIGSTSKQFTATAIALLAEDGALSLDDPISRYFSGFPQWAQSVTVRHLVHHTSGIPDYLELAFLAGKSDDTDYYTDEWVIELLARQQRTLFPPGQRHAYSNSGYVLLAHIVRQASGQSLSDFAEARIFGPLGMQDTHFHDDHGRVVPRRASGYAPAGDGYRISMTTLDIVGDGGVFTTIDDLLAWDRNFHENRLGRGGPGLIRQLTTPGALNGGEPTDYAFGLDVGDFRGLATTSHSGSYVGYRAEMIRFPEQRFSVAVLCNRSDADAPHLARQVAAVYLADSLAPEDQGPAAPAGEAGVALTAADLAQYAGDYWEDAEAFAAETRVEDGKLWAVHSPTRRNELAPIGPDRFRMLGVPGDVAVHFDRDAGGVRAMRLTIDGKPRGTFRPFRRRQAAADELAGYSGTYYSPELDVTYTLGLSSGALTFRVAHRPPLELTPMFDETFENPDYGAFTFGRSADGAIDGFVLQQRGAGSLKFSRQ